jgi:DNA helicase-2/ATP-dependent DNA helicase PcrA
MSAALNPEQEAAVLHAGGPLLILAGAGTGKTRVLVHRIAHLIQSGVSPWEILAVTFTNKAAGEMRERLGRMLGEKVPVGPRHPGAGGGMWVGTFHATCARLLRRWGERVGLTRSFVIFDDDDQQKLLSRLIKEAGLDEQVAPRSLSSRFDRAKNRGLDPTKQVTGLPLDEHVRVIYPRYQEQLAKENAVDFNDLLLKVTELAKDAEIGPRLATMFRHVLVDEFQDTNLVQYSLVQHLASATRNLTVVGDDDQSIYGWRGAEPRNLLDFDRDFPDAVVVKLEQNYRSTSVILDAANAVISHNIDRRGKALWTDRGGGDLIEWHELGDERSEADFVARAIRELIDHHGASPSDVATLYRTNAQTRPLEEQLNRQRIPHRIIGAVAFFQRKEIKDALAYVRLLANPAGDTFFQRVVNVPARGIGESTVDRVRAHATESGTSLLVAARGFARGDIGGITPAVRKKLAGFVDVIDGLAAVRDAGASMAELLIQTVERSGLRAKLEADDSPEATDRLGNLAALVSMASDFDDETAGEGTLDEFLERTALMSAADEGTSDDVVLMMTIHTAKGLEFPNVFLTGMEDGLFPSLREREDTSEADSLEEERRLAYVAITRARNRLVMTRARTRRVWGEIRLQPASRFIDDIPVSCIALPARAAPRAQSWAGGPPPMASRGRGWARPSGSRTSSQMSVHDEHDQRSHDDSEPVYDLDSDTRGEGGPYPGNAVDHAQFGRGRVVEASGSGRDRKLVVDFPTVGRKTVLARFVAVR